MKKSILLFGTTLLLLIGCAEVDPKTGQVKVDRNTDPSSLPSNPKVYEIDSCEYLVWGEGFTHKGNCKFCEERRNRK